tara:strand:- start:7869 stop:8012 length:144 start_codon:yes stop_codon:yes gene_type:complete
MEDLNKQYQSAKKNSIEFMKTGQITDYFKALLKMNKYKRLISAVVAN